MPPNPNTAAMTATMKNPIAQLSMLIPPKVQFA
jgi:hypothetical protein